MYLRLKRHCPERRFACRCPSAHARVRRCVRDELLHRHHAAFDWEHGGPPGPIKFIDLPQLEFATHRARAGDARAGTMVARYVCGFRRLFPDPASGAAHYATGPAWNTPCLTRTLAGQAVAIRALAFVGRLERSCTHAQVVRQLARFVTTRWRAHATGAVDTSKNPRGGPAVCERAWYLIALGAFAETYDDERLHAEALAGFSHLASDLSAHDPGFDHPDCRLTLTDYVALAALASEFQPAAGGTAFARYAGRALLNSASRCAHPAGGWVQQYRDGVPPDLDCSIDLVRSADALGSGLDPGLAQVAAAGRRALFEPELALLRMPESGLLMLLADCANGGRIRCPHQPGRRQSSCSGEDRDKPLVNVRE